MRAQSNPDSSSLPSNALHDGELDASLACMSPISATVDPEVRQFVNSQLVVIALPVGTLFGIWLWMLNWGGRSRRDQ